MVVVHAVADGLGEHAAQRQHAVRGRDLAEDPGQGGRAGGRLAEDPSQGPAPGKRPLRGRPLPGALGEPLAAGGLREEAAPREAEAQHSEERQRQPRDLEELRFALPLRLQAWLAAGQVFAAPRRGGRLAPAPGGAAAPHLLVPLRPGVGGDRRAVGAVSKPELRRAAAAPALGGGPALRAGGRPVPRDVAAGREPQVLRVGPLDPSRARLRVERAGVARPDARAAPGRVA
mmetsp:Transcript_28821/g.89699  ORF Transcript_28821/g.89699 Transcript_28821/m.89699 type:complete len:231 (+) Transcript_28821:658-1350(+)